MEPTFEELLSRCGCPSCRDVDAVRDLCPFTELPVVFCDCPACLAKQDESE